MTSTPVLVVWTDAGRISPWHSIRDAIEMPMTIIHTVGFVIDQSPERLLLAGSVQENANSAGAYEQIPISCIIKIKNLEEEK